MHIYARESVIIKFPAGLLYFQNYRSGLQEKFIEQMKVTPDLLCKEGTSIEKWHKDKKKIKVEVDYGTKTEQEIERLVAYLKDNGYTITRSKQPKK